jgi:hypothetical protein
MAIIALNTFLKQRLQQLEQRETMIPVYIANPKKFLGQKFTKQDLITTQEQIKETKAAIEGIAMYKRGEMPNLK